MASGISMSTGKLMALKAGEKYKFLGILCHIYWVSIDSSHLDQHLFHMSVIHHIMLATFKHISGLYAMSCAGAP